MRRARSWARSASPATSTRSTTSVPSPASMPAASARTTISTPRRLRASTSRRTRRCATRARGRAGKSIAGPPLPGSRLPHIRLAPARFWEVVADSGPGGGPGSTVWDCGLVNRAAARDWAVSVDGSVRRLGVSAPDCGRRYGLGEGNMGNSALGSPAVAAAVALAAFVLTGCATSTSQQDATPAAVPQPELPSRIRASEIVGRWGYAAFHKPEDRARVEANARGQCKQAFTIGQGPTGGVMMYLADSTQLQELRVKGSTTGKDYIGPAGDTPGQQDREIVSFDGRVMLLRFVDPEIDGRYGTGVFVRCAPRA